MTAQTLLHGRRRQAHPTLHRGDVAGLDGLGEAIGSGYIKGGCDTANRQGENEGRCGFEGAPSGGEIIGVDAVVHRRYVWAAMGEGHVLNHMESA